MAVDISNLTRLIVHQVKNTFFCEEVEETILHSSVPEIIPSIDLCFSEISNKYYANVAMGGAFNPFHSGQYSIFLYFLSRHVWVNYKNAQLADKLYYLNKMLNGFDLFYQVKMPDIFFLEHPVGSVIGRGVFSNYFVFQQNCTVGGNKGAYPSFGNYVWLFANAVVVGASRVGNNVFVSAGTYIKDTNIPDNTIVFGRSPNLILKSKPAEYFYEKSPFRIHHS